ncbi:MAG: thymidylate kinase [Acidobacteriaceae bacterium]
MRAQDRRSVAVSFSGMDGAGKSTQIDALARYMEQSGLQVQRVAFWDDVARLTSFRETAGHKIFRGDKGVGTPEKPIERRDKNVRSRFMSLVRLFLYTVDAVSLRMVAIRYRRSGSDLIIFDRYAYDELVNLNLNNPLVRIYARFVMWLTPRPDVSYVLDANPVEARARKPEYPLDFLIECRESYKALNRTIGGMTIIPPMPVAEVHREVLRFALEQLSAKGIVGMAREARLDGDVIRTAAS